MARMKTGMSGASWSSKMPRQSTVMNRPKQQQKQEKSTQTEKLMRMEVKVEELTIESIRDRLRTTDLRLSGSKQQLADRLTENSTW